MHPSTGFDDMLIIPFVSGDAQTIIGQEMLAAKEQYVKDNQFENKNNRIWYSQRLFCFTRAVLAIWCSFYPISMIKSQPLFSTNFGNEHINCNGLVIGLLVLYYLELLLIIANHLLIRESFRVALKNIIRDILGGWVCSLVLWSCSIFALETAYHS